LYLGFKGKTHSRRSHVNNNRPDVTKTKRLWMLAGNYRSEILETRYIAFGDKIDIVFQNAPNIAPARW